MKSLLLVALVSWLSACLGACAGQGEGALCSKSAGNSGNDDCKNGLTCNATVTPSTPGYGRCCPDPSQATTSICKGSSGGLNASAAPPDAATERSPTEGGIEAALESGSSDASAAEAAPEGSPSDSATAEGAPEGSPSDAPAVDASLDGSPSDATAAEADAHSTD